MKYKESKEGAYIVRTFTNCPPEFRRKEWYRDGKLHRIDGPAVECASGIKSWYQDGKLHRDSGPAVEYPDGDREWYQDGKLHRLDGPALGRVSDEGMPWYFKGELIDCENQEEFERLVEQKLLDELK